jgi:benzil reductase ((S)-benzoin forming)
MQTQLRAGDPQLFPDRDNFARLKETDALTSPEQAAGQVLAYLARPDFGDPVIADVRDA